MSEQSSPPRRWRLDLPTLHSTNVYRGGRVRAPAPMCVLLVCEPALKQLQANGQIFLWILPDGFDQFLHVSQQLIRVVVHGGIAQKFTRASFARIEPVGQILEAL